MKSTESIPLTDIEELIVRARLRNKVLQMMDAVSSMADIEPSLSIVNLPSEPKPEGGN